MLTYDHRWPCIARGRLDARPETRESPQIAPMLALVLVAPLLRLSLQLNDPIICLLELVPE